MACYNSLRNLYLSSALRYPGKSHAIESLFWVVTYVCLVCRGPGANMHRKYWRKKNAMNYETFWLVISFQMAVEIRACERNLFTDDR